MSAVITGVLTLLSIAFPPAAPVIAAISPFIPAIIAAEPLVVALINQGIPALRAAEQAAPDVLPAIKALIAKLPNMSHTGTSDAHAEQTTRILFGFPRMTFDEEMAWMDRASPISENSRSGSG